MAIAGLAGAGCTSARSSDDSSTQAELQCDPLAVGASPIALAALVGAGRASDGTVYVLDRGPTGIGTGLRAFVLDGALLRRRHILGSGGGPDFVVVTLDDPGNELQLRVEIANGSATKMGVFRGPPDPSTKSFEIGAQGEELVLLSTGDLSSFTLANTSNVQVMYAATTDDGHRFIAFTTNVDYSDDKVRVFYGTHERMVQRKVLSISYDSSVHLELDLDGVRTLAQLIFCNSATAWGTPRLEPAGGASIPLTPAPGSPGAGPCATRGSPAPAGDGGDTGDAGDAGASPPLRPAEPAELVAGLRFYCF